MGRGRQGEAWAATYRLADVGFGEEELGAEVVLGDDAVVDEGERGDAGEDEVLGHLVAERLDVDEQNVRVADLLLRLHAPEADLAVVEGDLV